MGGGVRKEKRGEGEGGRIKGREGERRSEREGVRRKGRKEGGGRGVRKEKRGEREGGRDGENGRLGRTHKVAYIIPQNSTLSHSYPNLHHTE